MTTASVAVARPFVPAWAVPATQLAVLTIVVGARWWATRAGFDALATGAAFAAAVLAAAMIGVPIPSPAPLRRIGLQVATGAAFGLALVGIVIAGAAIGGNTLVPGLGRPAAPMLPWAFVTILVASAEEALLRGSMFDATRRAGGVLVAVLVTTVVFALMHVPLYGWHVVPLDLAVGLGFAGLRISTRGIAAPIAAHAVADLATWWL